jgi:tRNA modification GTPase
MAAFNDTIAAIATGQVQAALGVIRVSGPEAISLVDSLFRGRSLTEVAGHSLQYGRLEENGRTLDEVVVGLYRAPKSFTGEDVVEISGHGSPVLLQEILAALLRQGCRPAEAGEFTQRAFLNGKLDLAQAEAVADVIGAESSAAGQLALQQLRGGVSRKLKALRAELVEFSALMELELDFSEEDVEFADRSHFRALLTRVRATLDELLQSFAQGNAIKEGVRVVIAGRPNAGKSTLLNALLQDERALVSSIPGTTRDAVEDVIRIEGISFRFVDTAGIRETEDTIERMGIERALAKIREADLFIYLFDINETPPGQVTDDIQALETEKPYLLAGTQVDRAREAQRQAVALALPEALLISAQTGEQLESLRQKLLETMALHRVRTDQPYITNARHYEALRRALESIDEVQNNLEAGLSTDLLAVDIRRSLYHIGTITGEVSSHEILGEIFSRFCIGK